MKVVLRHLVGRLPERLAGLDEIGTDLRILGLDELVVEGVEDRVEEFLGLEIEGLRAVDAEVPIGRGLLLAARARDRRDGLVVFVGDLEAVHRRVVLLLGLPAELRDVAGDDGRSPRSALAVLDEGLGLAAVSEPEGVGLPKVGRRDGLVDASPLSRSLEALEEALVAEPIGRVQLRPEVVIVAAGVLREPSLEVRDGLDQVDVVLATLSVDADLEGVLAVADVADPHVVELPSAEPALEGDHDHRGVARVSGRTGERPDVLVELEHVRLVGLGLVVAGGLRRDPVVSVRDLVATGDVPSEEAERDPVVAVGLLRAILDVVGVVDPADGRLRGVLRRVEGLVGVVVALPLADERLVEADVGVFADPRDVSEELLVAVVPVVLPEQLELVAHVDEELAIALAPTPLSCLYPLAQTLYGLFRVTIHGTSLYSWDGKGFVEVPPPAYTNPFNLGNKLAEASLRPDESHNDSYKSLGVGA